MKKTTYGLGLLAAGLILVLSLTGCPNNGGDDNNNGGQTGDALTGLAVRDMSVNPAVPLTAVNDMAAQDTINLGVIRTPEGALGAITWETSPSDASAYITLGTPSAVTTTVTALAGPANSGTSNVAAIQGANEAGRVAIRAVSGTVMSPWVQIQVVPPPNVQRLDFYGVGTTLTVQTGYSRSLDLVLTPAHGVTGYITWAPLEGANPNVWVIPAADRLSATLHTGPTATAAPVTVTASSDIPGVTAASVNVSVIAGPGLVLFQQTDVGANATEQWPAANADGRFVIVNDAPAGGVASTGVTRNVFVTLYPPLNPDEGEITFSARVRIAAYHDGTRGNTRGLFMGFFNDPAGMGAIVAGQESTLDSALSASRHGTNGEVAMVVTRANLLDVSGAQHDPPLPATPAPPAVPPVDALPFDTEYIVTAIRDGRHTTFIIKDALGTELRRGIRNETDTQSMDINPIHVGFAVATSTVELSQITITQGGTTFVNTGVTLPTVPPAYATEVLLAAEGPTTVAPGTNVVVNATVLPGNLTNRAVTWAVNPPSAIVGTPTGASVTVTLATAGVVSISAVSSAPPNVSTTEALVITFDEEGTARLPLGADPWVIEGDVGAQSAASSAIINEQLPEGISLTGNWRWRPGDGQGLDPNGTGRTVEFSADFVSAATTITLYVSGTHADNLIDEGRLAAIWTQLPPGALTVTDPWNPGTEGRNTIVINVAASTAALSLTWPWGAANGADAPGRLSILSIDRTAP